MQFYCEKQTETLSDNAVTIHNKMQVINKEITQDGAKSNAAKWNLMGGVQFKHVKHCLLFM